MLQTRFLYGPRLLGSPRVQMFWTDHSRSVIPAAMAGVKFMGLMVPPSTGASEICGPTTRRVLGLPESRSIRDGAASSKKDATANC
jgi:hypothetical protein